MTIHEDEERFAEMVAQAVVRELTELPPGIGEEFRKALGPQGQWRMEYPLISTFANRLTLVWEWRSEMLTFQIRDYFFGGIVWERQFRTKPGKGVTLFE